MTTIKSQSNVRSSHRRCAVRKGVPRVLRNFAKFTENHLYQRLFFNRPATLLKKSFWHRCFPLSFAKFLTTLFTEHLRKTAFATRNFYEK